MAQARTPLHIIYACISVVAVTLLFLMIYSGMLNEVGEGIFELMKEIAKFFLG